MDVNGLLPNGSIVRLKGVKQRMMTIGICQKTNDESNRVFDYAGVVYPAGYLDADKLVLFDQEQIEKVYMLGYQDDEAFAFKEQVEKIITQERY